MRLGTRIVLGIILLSLRLPGQNAKRITHQVHLVLQSGQWLGANRAAFSDDGKYVLVSGNEDSAKLYDAESGLELRTFSGHKSEVMGLAISRDDRYAATADSNGVLNIWNLRSGVLAKSFRVPNAQLQSLAFSRDTLRVAAGGNKYTSYVWDLASGAKIATLVIKQPFADAMDGTNSVEFLPDGNRLFVKGVTLAIFDIAKQMAVIQEGLWRGDLSADGRVLVTGLTSVPDKVSEGFQVIDVDTGKRTTLGHTEPNLLALSTDGKLAAAIDNNQLVAHIWDVATARETQQIKLPGDAEKPIYSAVFSRDGSQLVTSAQDGVLRIWNVASGHATRAMGEREGVASVVSYSPDGQNIFGGCQVGLCKWNAVSGTLEWSIGTTSYFLISPRFAPGNGPLAVRQFATPSADDSILLFDRQTGQITSIPAPGTSAIAFSRDGKRIFSGTDTDAAIWDVASHLRTITLKTEALPGDFIYSAAFSRDGNLVAAGTDGRKIHIWNSNSGEAVATLSQGEITNSITSVEFSPDGRRLLCRGQDDDTAVIWDLATKRELLRFTHTSVASFSPDGRFVLTDYGSEPARLWDAGTGQRVRDFEGINFATRVAFLPGGREALAGSSDGMISIWNFNTGQLVRRFGPAGGGDPDLSEDGSQLAIVGPHKLMFWDVQNGRELATVVSFLDGTWAAVDPEGRYDASDPNRVRGIHWVVDNEPIEFRQLKGRFYTHNLLSAVFKHEKLPAIGETLEQIRMYPDVAVEAPQTGSQQLRVKLTDKGYGVGSVIVKVNDKTLFDGSPPSNEFTVDLGRATQAEDGRNVIEVLATAPSESVTSRGVKVLWRTSPSLGVVHKLYAIVVGVSKFSGGQESMNLRYPAKDAAAMARAIQIGTNKLFDEAIVRLLTSDSPDPLLLPTKANIQREFAGVAAKAGPADTVLLYLAGHGVAQGANSYFFLTQDAHSTDLDSDAVRRAWAVSSGEIGHWILSDMKSTKTVVILDTCAAGAAESAMTKREPSRDQIKAIELLNDKVGSHILMGSAADKVSYESSRYGQGLLTYALLSGMKGAAPFRDQSLFVDTWFRSAEDEVVRLSSGRGVGEMQRPYSSIRGQDFPIAFLDDGEKKNIPLAVAKSQVLRAVCLTTALSDPLKLGPQVREQLRAMDQPAGADYHDPGFIYLDDIPDGLPGAIIPRVSYTVMGETVQATISLFADGDEKLLAKSPEIQMPLRDASKLASEIAESIAQLVR
jgi:WD40 repeat protein